MTALQHLNELADKHKAQRSPNFPAKYIPRSHYRDRDANGLTRCIVDYLNYSGYFATRLAGTGTYRDDIKKYIPSQQRAGLPDVMAVVMGRAVFVEVKAGKDHLSENQKATIAALSQAGAWCIVVHSFEEFHRWFTAQFCSPPIV